VSTTPRPRVVAVVGTTASGKSALAHRVARDLGDVAIGTVDSMTVYRGMDIGTAKATPAERAEVPYYLLDLADPSEEFTVAAFQDEARLVEDQQLATGAGLLYVGGTGLYGRAVIDALTIPGQYPELREVLNERAYDELDVLYADLQRLDPLAASRMERTNARRIVRALEVTIGSGRPFSSYGDGLESYGTERIVQIGLRVDRDELDQRIAARFSAWMESGLLDEVRTLAELPQGLSRTARQAVGYKELLSHLDGELTLDEAIEQAISATRRLARRQRRWFARDPRVRWFDDVNEAEDALRQLIAPPASGVGN